ncbi:MAG: hypothetical protein ACLQNE_02450, partial [Thermoguttaceae bacterium]
MHNLDMVVSKDDPLVHPVPAPGFLMYPDRRRLLAADVGPADRFIPTSTSPAGLLSSRVHEFVWRNWNAAAPSKLAKILGAKVEEVTALAESMGLPAA